MPQLARFFINEANTSIGIGLSTFLFLAFAGGIHKIAVIPIAYQIRIFVIPSAKSLYFPLRKPKIDHKLFRLSGAVEETRHVKMKDVETVQIGFKFRILCDFVRLEKFL